MTVVNLVAETPEAETEIHVFVAIHEAGVEPAHLVEERSPDHCAGARDDLKLARLADGGMVGAESGVDVVWRQELDLGLVHVLASDSHGPHISREGLGAVARSIGDAELARYLTVDVPGAIVAGEPVPERPQVGLGA